jgi:RNA polymerase sigma-70 factor (ECF subfamily)
LNEKKIIRGCIENNIVSQQLLYEKYSNLFFSICLKYAKNRENAQDILQESFIIIYTSIKKYKGTGSFEGWMKRIVINQSISGFKKEIKFNVLINENNIGAVDIDSSIIETVPLDVILEQIQELPDRYRLVFNLYEMDSYSHSEISKMLAISEGTSKSNLHRAKIILKEKLSKWQSNTKNHSYGN